MKRKQTLKISQNSSDSELLKTIQCESSFVSLPSHVHPDSLMSPYDNKEKLLDLNYADQSSNLNALETSVDTIQRE